MGGVYRKTHNLPGIQIDDCGDIHESPLKRDIREVGTPDVVLIHGICRHQEVRVDHLDIRCFVPFPASPAIRLDAEEIHHSLHLLAIHCEVDGEAA